MSEIGHLAARIARAAKGRDRFVVAIAGPPAAGKSTLARGLADALTGGGLAAATVSLDGFHYDDAVLETRGLRQQKGAPETFDVTGFIHLLGRLRDREADVAVPVFDRRLEIARAGGAVIGEACRIVLVEGNYLLLDEAPWDRMAPLFDLTVFLSAPSDELERRLLLRWAELDRADGPAWVASNDMPNVGRVLGGSRPADITLG